MLRVKHCVALALVMGANGGMSNAANHPASFGAYSTAVSESRLFVSDNTTTTLRCDLFFSATDSDQIVVAPKGSVVSQTVPSFVWQYSGLLPVSDYLKTVAIHSTSSDIKEDSWQDVQLAFYNGLRVEGVRESDAKIAFAGAYAFAPRWPLVELIDITDPVKDKDTRLYKVKYTPAGTKGVSVSDYRTLAQDILSAPESVSLQDIRGVIDAADASKEMEAKRVVGSSVSDLFASNRETAKTEELPEELPAIEPVIEKEKEFVTGTSLDELFSDEVMKAPEIDPAIDEMKVEMIDIPVESVEIMVPPLELESEPLTDEMSLETPEVLEENDKAILGPEDPLIEDNIVDTESEAEDQPSSVTVDTSLGTQPDVWKTLPDGSEVLLQIEG